jgi:hypothetical protein
MPSERTGMAKYNKTKENPFGNRKNDYQSPPSPHLRAIPMNQLCNDAQSMAQISNLGFVALRCDATKGQLGRNQCIPN